MSYCAEEAAAALTSPCLFDVRVTVSAQELVCDNSPRRSMADHRAVFGVPLAQSICLEVNLGIEGLETSDCPWKSNHVSPMFWAFGCVWFGVYAQIVSRLQEVEYFEKKSSLMQQCSGRQTLWGLVDKIIGLSDKQECKDAAIESRKKKRKCWSSRALGCQVPVQVGRQRDAS